MKSRMTALVVAGLMTTGSAFGGNDALKAFAHKHSHVHHAVAWLARHYALSGSAAALVSYAAYQDGTLGKVTQSAQGIFQNAKALQLPSQTQVATFVTGSAVLAAAAYLAEEAIRGVL